MFGIRWRRLLGMVLLMPFGGLLAFQAANWDLFKPAVVAAGDVRCTILDTKEKIWEAETSGLQATGCEVVIRHRAPQSKTSACSSTLYWTNSDGSAGKGDGPVGAGKAAVLVTIPSAKKIEMSCKGTEEDMKDDCHWEIDRVSCTRPGDNEAIKPIAGGMVVRHAVGCRKIDLTREPEVVWTKPKPPDKNQSCNVTVNWSGSKDCSGTIHAGYPGNEQDSTAGPKKSMLMTFVGVLRLKFDCSGAAASDEKCSYSIVSTECK